MQETQVQSLGQKDPLEKGMAYPPQYPCLENSLGRGACWAAVCEVALSHVTERLTLSLYVCATSSLSIHLSVDI